MKLVNLSPSSQPSPFNGPLNRHEALGDAIVELALVAIDAGQWENAREHVHTALHALEAEPPKPPTNANDASPGEHRVLVPLLGDPLTAAELRLVPYLPTHLTIQEIANRMYLSKNTISTQISAIYRKLGARNRHEAVQRAIESGLLAEQSLKHAS